MGIDGISAMTDATLWTVTKNGHGAHAVAREIAGVGIEVRYLGTANCGSRRCTATARNWPQRRALNVKS